MYGWKSHFVIQADYQHWANEAMLASLGHLTPDSLTSDQGLYFRSIHHTVDHMLTVLKEGMACLQGECQRLNHWQLHHTDWGELQSALRHDTRRLQTWLQEQEEDFFEREIAVSGADCRPQPMWARDLLTHLFTHAAHCRGQVIAAACRLGAPYPQLAFSIYRREMERLLNELRQGEGRDPTAG
ncbi:MAG: hypothetical protein N2Z63_11465 [Thiobacillaceae bacterium]|nr:hypothetical protein [Thiobacillaceae bacterium]